jgi:hypothetical protein
LQNAQDIGEFGIVVHHTRPSAPTNRAQHRAIVLNGPIA